MKRLILSILTLISVSFAANAQAWLFPGKNRNTRKDSSVVTVSKDSSATAQPRDSIMLEDLFIPDIPDVIKVSLLLPVKSTSEKPSSNFLEYCNGALMAVRELGQRGIAIDLSIYDTDDRTHSLDYQAIAESDVIIGPVKSREIEALSHRCPDKFIVSPIEPKAEALTDSLNVIQAPSSWMNQTSEMVRWLAEETTAWDRIIVLKDNSDARSTEKTDYLTACLEASGLDYRVINSSNGDLDDVAGTLRFVVASENDVFICSAINNIATLSSRKEVALYTTSSVRSLEGIKSASLFNAKARMTASYYIDYESRTIQSFVMDYRALFHHEPTSFAFSGYDTANYFISMCRDYGRNWNRKLHRKQWKGLQTDFSFDRKKNGGNVNKAVRRVVYNTDFSINLL